MWEFSKHLPLYRSQFLNKHSYYCSRCVKSPSWHRRKMCRAGLGPGSCQKDKGSGNIAGRTRCTRHFLLAGTRPGLSFVPIPKKINEKYYPVEEHRRRIRNGSSSVRLYCSAVFAAGFLLSDQGAPCLAQQQKQMPEVTLGPWYQARLFADLEWPLLSDFVLGRFWGAGESREDREFCCDWLCLEQFVAVGCYTTLGVSDG